MSQPTHSRHKSSKSKKVREIDERPGVVTQFYQTKLCKHFENGSCLYGDKSERLRERPNLTKTKLCPSTETGVECGDMEACPYAHSLNELRATPMLFRTVLCSWWKKGQCEFGDNCRFAHGEQQLRESSSVGSEASPRNKSASSLTSDKAPGRTDNSMSTSYPSPPARHPAAPSPTVHSPHYSVVYSAALAAVSAASLQNGVTVLTPTQTMAIAAAASAAAIEAASHLPPLPHQPQYGYHQPPVPQPVPSPDVSVQDTIRAELNRMKKGFASSPALMSFFGQTDDESVLDVAAEWVDHSGETGRPRADSDPGTAALNTENLMQELQRLWTNDHHVEGVPLMRSDPFLSASHMTLDGYQINND